MTQIGVQCEMSEEKYLRLAGFDQAVVPLMKGKNRVVKKILEEMIQASNNMIHAHTDGTTVSLGAAISKILEDTKTRGVPKDILRACHRIKTLPPLYSAESCVIGRNNFLDALNIKQVTSYVTGQNMTSTPLGALSRKLSAVL